MAAALNRILWFCCTLLAACRCDNIETRIHLRLEPTASDPVEFGSSLASHGANLYAGAPKMDMQGGMFSCLFDFTGFANASRACTKITFDGDGNRTTGAVMEKLASNDHLLVCGNQYQISCPDLAIEQRMIGECFTYSFNDRVKAKLPSLCPIACPRGLVADIVFVMDESGSVGIANFKLGLEWVINVLRGFSYDIDRQNVQVGYVVYENVVSINVAPTSKNYYQLKGEISAITYSTGGTNTHLGIAAAETSLLSNSRGVAKIMIVMTDGNSFDYTLTEAAASKARGKNIEILAVGIGGGISQNELEAMASAPISQTVMTVTDYSKLDSILDRLSKVISETASTSLEGGSSNSTTELTNCQFGTSVHASARGVYIGAVGAYDRTGTVAEYNDLSSFATTVPNGHLNSTELEDILGLQTINSLKDSYFGYSVTSGTFTRESVDWVVMSAPRYFSRGMVLIYHEQSKQYNIVHPSEASGYWQLGEYYGHSVLSLDINDDGFDDLLVSAPLYSETAGYDEGIVFVYMNSAATPGAQIWVQPTFKPVTLKGGSVPGARFGLTIASAGDIDKNGYQDIVVGAPAERGSTSGSGSIYIYFSTSAGVSDANMQKILGKSVSRSGDVFKWFGASVEGGSDFDENGYPDIAVAAPSSDRVILLRSRKLIQVTLTTEVLPANIDLLRCATNPTTACSRVKTCISAALADGTASSAFGMVFNVTLDSLVRDPAHKRFYFLSSGLHVIYQSVNVGGDPTCRNYDMQIKTASMGALNGGGLEVIPEVQLSVDFSQSHKGTIMSGVMSANSEKVKSASWTIDKGCRGVADRCEHDLFIIAEYSETASSTPILLDGSSKKLSMNVTIRNNGPDYAFFLKVNITSGNLTIIKMTGDCVTESDSESDSTAGLTVIKYKSSRTVFPDRMLSGESCNFSIEFDFARLQAIASEPSVYIAGSIYSNAGGDEVAYDGDDSNNIFRFGRPLQYKTDLLLDGASLPKKIFFNQTADNTQIVLTTLDDRQLGGTSTDVVHSYSIYNSGPLGLANGRVKLTWPEKTKSGHFLLYLVAIRCEPESACTCQTEGKANPLNIAPKASSFGPYVTEYQTKSINLADAFVSSDPVNCEDSQCSEVFCNLNFMSTYSEVDILAEFKPWLPSFGKEFSSTQVSSVLQLLPPNTTVNANPEERQVATTLSTYDPTEPPPEPTSNAPNIGAIIGGIIGGILLLVIIVAAMWKAGFFKKTKYGKMTRDARRTIRESTRASGGMPGEEGPSTAGGQLNKSTEDLCE